jgi:hypothetical protein
MKKQEDTQLDPPDEATLDALFEYLVEEYDDPIATFDLLALIEPPPTPARH